MRAVMFDTYGGPDVLGVRQVPEPHAGRAQVRIRVRAASINLIDCKRRRGELDDGRSLTTPTG